MKFTRLDILGYVLILFGLVGLVANIINNTFYNFIWFCNHMSILLGIAFLARSRVLMMAELSIALIPQLIWSIDFLGKLFFDIYIFNTANYMFALEYQPVFYYLSLNHLLLIPVAIYGVWKLGKPVWAWKWSVVHGLILVPFSLIFGHNLNCLGKSCLPAIPSGTAYYVLGPIAAVAMFWISNWIIINLYKKLKK